MTLGPLTFLAPLALWGLLVLPLIWWIMRITPPKPLEQVFPPLRLLMDVKKEEETPQSTPVWLLLFRLLLGALIAVALAKPILFQTSNDTSRPLVLIIDNGWAAAGNWNAVTREAESLTKQMISENKQVAVLTSTNPNGTSAAKFMPAREALKVIQSLQPTPYSPDRAALADRVSELSLTDASIVWFSDGVALGNSDNLQQVIKSASQQIVYFPDTENSPLIAGRAEETANGFRSHWHRVDTQSLRSITIAAYGPQGQIIARSPLQFAPGQKDGEAEFELPAELRRQVSFLKPERFASAGSVTLFDDSWGRPLVGLLAGSDVNTQPLLSEWHYIEKALRPNADIYRGDLDQLLSVSPSIIFMSDRARNDSAALKSYVEDGGLLVRFAGPKLAARTDALLPVPVRQGGRELGGALAWEDPQGFAAFSPDSPFFGLSIDENITVKKQIMARPGAQTDSRTWARLQDGSPVITSAPLGLGRIVLFHVTAGPDWSELPLSGLYVGMLKRILPLARSTSSAVYTTGGNWTAERTLNGYGVLGTVPLAASPIANDSFEQTPVSFTHPAGLYRQGVRRKALNTIRDPQTYQRLQTQGIPIASYADQKPKSLAGFLLSLVAILIALDVILALIASGRLRFGALRTMTAIFALSLCAGLLQPIDTLAQDEPGNEALELHLAYVVTGDPATDRMSKAGLEGLVGELTRRTTIEPKGVRGVNIESDELAYYPFLYWPVTRDVAPISASASTALNAYMTAGGTIVFDTQDDDSKRLLGNQPHPGMVQISKNLDIPRLAAPPADHVITKSFYLLQIFAGRWATGKIWLEADNQGNARDGVSSVIVGSNDWAAAWAKDDRGRYLAVIEDEIPRQREMAYRFGVNLTMYALSGNYKADLVHTATLIERLGNNGQQIEQSPDNQLGEGGEE